MSDNVKLTAEEFYKQIPKLEKGRLHLLITEEIKEIVRLAKEGK